MTRNGTKKFLAEPGPARDGEKGRDISMRGECIGEAGASRQTRSNQRSFEHYMAFTEQPFTVLQHESNRHRFLVRHAQLMA